MYKIKVLFVLIFCIGIICSCTMDEISEEPNSNISLETPGMVEELFPEETETTGITDVDIILLMDAFHLFQEYTEYSSDSMPVDQTITDASGRYFKVTDEKYDTWIEWIAFIESIFCGEYLTERLKNSELYINIDGFTYCCPGSMGWYLSKEYTYEIIENSKSDVIIDIKREDLSPGNSEMDVETFRYVLHLTDAGWRIAGQVH